MKFIVFKNKKDDTHKELDRPGIHAEREDTHSLRLKSELFYLRSGYVNRRITVLQTVTLEHP